MAGSSSYLVLQTRKQEQDQDDVLSAIANIAYATPSHAAKLKARNEERKKPEPEKKKPKKKRSRFFFHLSPSFAESVEVLKEGVQQTSLDVVNGEVDKKLKVYAKELPPKLTPNIEKVYSFFTKEMGPKVLAVSAGTTQAMDVLQRTLDAPVDQEPFAQFERMVKYAHGYRMAEFITKYMGVPESLVPELLASITPRKEAYIFHPTEPERRSAQQQPQPVTSRPKRKPVNDETERLDD
jgi:hypothetical protein